MAPCNSGESERHKPDDAIIQRRGLISSMLNKFGMFVIDLNMVESNVGFSVRLYDFDISYYSRPLVYQ